MAQTDKILKKIRKYKNTLESDFGVKDIALFGSYANNSATDNSDIDIVVELNKGSTTFDNFMNIRFFLEDLTGKHVDLCIKDSIRQELKDKILAEAVHV